MSATQEHRIAAVTSPLAGETLLFRTMRMSDRLSTLFEIQLEVFCSNDSVDLEKMLGQNMTVRLQLPKNQTRYYNGYISHFSQCGQTDEFHIYALELRPWLWFLSKTYDCRIFQEKTQTVPDIILEVFKLQGFTDYENKLTGTYPSCTYCVQYRESDFDFVSRLMEREGIYYYFKHENGNHQLVLVDSNSAHESIEHYSSIPYYPPEDHNRRNQDHIHTWKMHQSIHTGTCSLTDFDFTKSRTDLLSKSSITKSHNGSQYEKFDYPGQYDSATVGKSYAEVRIEELHSSSGSALGEGHLRALYAGGLFTLENYPRSDQNKEYLVVATQCEILPEDYRSGGEQSDSLFSSQFEVLDNTQQFRAPRITPLPIIQGPQTAMVVGKSGEEIWTDEYGRVKVRFHWDRYSEGDDTSSCWIRVAQIWAGKNWGAIYLPRIGQEVIIEFLEGDPDRPIITGRVYNDACKPPYELPKEKTKSTLKSNSSKDGGGFNEIRFEDSKGDEQVFIHAEKDSDLRTKNDHKQWVGNDAHLHVVNHQLEQVDADKHSTVKGNRNTEIKQSDSIKIGMDKHEKVGSNFALDSGQQIHLKAGMTAVIEAGTSLTLKVGGNFVNLSSAGVSIKGTMVNINSGGAAGSGSGSKPDKPELPEDADDAEAGGKAEAVMTTSNTIEQQSFSKNTVADFSNQESADLKSASQTGIGFIK